MLAFAGCGSDDAAVSSNDAGGGSSSSSSSSSSGSSSGQEADASVTTDGSSDLDGSASDADVSDAAFDDDASASLSCEQLADAYHKQFLNARTCNPADLIDQCTQPREDELGCGCNGYLNASRIERLDKIATRWAAKGCVPQCSKKPCKIATKGACIQAANGPSGTCTDQFGGVP